MFRALVSHYNGFGWDEFMSLTLPQWGGLLGLDKTDPSESPDLVEAHEQLAKKRGPSPDRQ